ncbi:MAG: ribulose-phosphate 3-epimerase, partial [Armatimonadetes bacterium]|nr:ribulose-phosphate 3-epimerase [Armatimonadota bacterium]
VEAVAPALEECDQVMLMSVFPGRAGQKFIEDTYGRLEQLAALIEATGRNIIVSVDGGVVPPIAQRLAKLGARAFVSGSYFFEHPEGYAGAVQEFREALAAVE